MSKKIYRDFNHWWCEGDHGYSSASRDHVKTIWDDLEPTILASRDEYKETYVEMMKEVAKGRSEHLDALLEYIELFKKDDAPKFYRWWIDQVLKKSPGEKDV